MNRVARLAVGAAVGLVVIACLALQADTRLDDKDKVAAAQVAVLKMADKLGDGKLAQSFAGSGDYTRMEVMHQFKFRNKGGIGVGATVPPGFKDSIELTINDLAIDRKGFTRDAVTKFSPELVTLARQTQAIAEINAHYAPKDKVGEKDPVVWKKWNDEMKKGSADLAKAAQAKDATMVRTAASKLSASCSECHKIFRDE
jgi:cytochrome c556